MVFSAMFDSKHPLSITLAEPIVFLRSSDPSGRHQTNPDDSPTLVRGILTLNVVRPIEISSIEVELSSMLTISYPEGIGPRRVEIMEKQKIYSSSVTVFRAYPVIWTRPASMRRGLPAAGTDDGDEHADMTSRLPSLRRERSKFQSLVASRSCSGFSLGSVLDAVKGITSRPSSRSPDVADSEEVGYGRTRARNIGEQQDGEGILEVDEVGAGTGNENALEAHASHPSGQDGCRERHLLRIGRDRGDAQVAKEYGPGRKEFMPGTYSYPISFLLPPNLPPTSTFPYGSVRYVIKSVAHRPGPFTSKLSCKVPLLVVASPATGTREGNEAGDSGPFFVEKQWEGVLAYSLGLSSCLFLLGSQRNLDSVAGGEGNGSLVEVTAEARAEATYGTAVLNLTLLPLDKVKIWKLTVVVDQRIKYVDGRGKLYREDDYRRVRLLEVQDACSAEEMCLLDDADQIHRCKRKGKRDTLPIPLLPTPISPHRSPLLRYMSSSDPSVLMGPGPYTLSTSIGLPGRGYPFCGSSGLNFTTKSSGVSVEHHLRVIIRVERVSDGGACDQEDKRRLFDVVVQTPITILSCRCAPELQRLPRYSRNSEDDMQRPSPLAQSSHPSPTIRSTHQSHPWATHVVCAPTPTSTFHPTLPPSPLARYERLVSGLESEAGEAPPSYESVASRS